MSKVNNISIEEFEQVVSSELKAFVLKIQKDQHDNPDNWTYEGGVCDKQCFGDWMEQFSDVDNFLVEENNKVVYG